MKNGFTINILHIYFLYIFLVVTKKEKGLFYDLTLTQNSKH